MPNNSYLRSREVERKLVLSFRRHGFVSARSAGSKSKVDVWAVRKPRPGKIGIVFLTQIKTQKGGRKILRKTIEEFPARVRFVWLTKT